MKRWIVPLLLVVLVGGIVVYRLATTGSTARRDPANSMLHDPAAHASMRKAMRSLGYGEETYSGYEWGSASCDYHTYLVRPDVPTLDSFFFIRSLKTGEMQFLANGEIDQELKKHVNYDGRFLGLSRGLGDGQEEYSLGSTERGGEHVFVYVRFDETACGLTATQVQYWGPRVSETVKLNLQLLPKK